LGIGTGLHYPAINGFSLYKKLGYQVSATPIAERIGKSILTLPLFPGLTQTNVEFISKSLVAILKKHAK